MVLQRETAKEADLTERRLIKLSGFQPRSSPAIQHM